MSFEQVKRGVIKRTQRREIGIFVDGINLDRASRRLNRKINFEALLKSLSGGLTPKVARYYTVIPYEDDSRQHSFFDVLQRAGFDLMLKRLPPLGVERQVTTDVEMSSDMVAFSQGIYKFAKDDQYLPEEYMRIADQFPRDHESNATQDNVTPSTEDSGASKILKVITAVTPSREVSYAIGLTKDLGADTITADFASIATGDKMKSAAKWIDLTDSESIWK